MARRSDGEGRFIAEFELVVSPHTASVIRKRFEAGRMVYNALLTEALKRYDLFQQSRLYQKARRIPKNTSEQRQARTTAFKAAREAWNWSEMGLTVHLQRFGQQFTQTWLNRHLNSQIVKKLAERVARTVIAYSLGRKGRPRFKRRGSLLSLEAINNLQGIILKTDARGHLFAYWGAGRTAPHLELPLIVYPDDAYHQHALATMRPMEGFPGLKYTRIIRRVIRGCDRFYAQVVLAGQPYQRQQIHRHGVVGLDIGPSTIAIVGEGTVRFSKFCDELQNKERLIRVLQRRIDRQRRANNPDCYDEAGRWIRGRRASIVSHRMRRSLNQLGSIHQQQTAHRKSLQGHLVREILTVGSDFRLEKLSYRSFQRNFGRSTQARAPSMFVAHLKRKAAEIGAVVTEFSPYHTRLSQICHNCGTTRKKSLSERVHHCSCGIHAHRDLYSAYLARFVDDDHVDLAQAAAQFERFRSLLMA
jgi:putative transposase